MQRQNNYSWHTGRLPLLPPAKVVLNDTFVKYSKGQYYQLKLNIEQESSKLRMLEGLLKEENYFAVV